MRLPKIAVELLLPSRIVTLSSCKDVKLGFVWRRLNSTSSDYHRQKVSVPLQRSTAAASSTNRIEFLKKDQSYINKNFKSKIKDLALIADPYMRLMRLDKPIGLYT